MKKFLAARWQDLIMANYEVDPELLASRVPPGTELDLNGGRCFVSLVGFMFLGTRVMGVPVPFHINFEEVNLRFYVTRETRDEIRRGICFGAIQHGAAARNLPSSRKPSHTRSYWQRDLI